MMYFLTQNIHNKDGKSDIDGGAIVQKNVHAKCKMHMNVSRALVEC